MLIAQYIKTTGRHSLPVVTLLLIALLAFLLWTPAKPEEARQSSEPTLTVRAVKQTSAVVIQETSLAENQLRAAAANPATVEPQESAQPALQAFNDGAQGPMKVSVKLPNGDWEVLDLPQWRSMGQEGANSQWTGTIRGEAASQVVITRWKGAVFGAISGQQGSFEIRARPTGELAVFPIDNLPCDVDADGIMDAEIESHADHDGLGNSVITIVIGYNQQAADDLGSIAILEAKILSAVELANQSYSYSNINLTLGLAWLGLVDYPYSVNQSFTQALNEAIDDDDGNADLLAQKRAEYGADFACLWLASDYTGGLAKVLTATSPPSNAYSVVRARNPLDTFIHEVGHNMGCRHLEDSYDGLVSSWYPDSFAHVFTGNNAQKYVTVMASTGNASSEGAIRIPYFSGTDVIYQGVPTGVLNDADCASTLRTNASTYEDFGPQPLLMGQAVSTASAITLTMNFGFVGETYTLNDSVDLSQWDFVEDQIADSDGVITDLQTATSTPTFYQWVGQ